MPKPLRSPLTRAECLALATDAHRLPEGMQGRQYQVVLTVSTVEWFQGLSSKERGAIVEAGRIAVGKTIENNQTMENDHVRISNIQK